MARRNDGFYEYTSAAEVRARAEKSTRTLANKKVAAEPVVVTGRKLVQTFWGQAWIKNLEHYADYANRLSRGRSYVRAGAILDLKIQPGKILAKVQGSRVRPYDVQINIQPLPENQVRRLSEICSDQLTSLENLLDGVFPPSLAEQFLAPGKGLFPSPREISLGCSCPDWAVMCKHVAAVLYGVGVRLDEHPDLFFTLRQIDLDTLLAQSMQKHALSVLASQPDAQANETVLDLDASDLNTLFGLEPEAAAGQSAPVDQAKPKDEKPAEAPPIKRRRGRPRKNPVA
jgi:uncharacterized Zn finger protein